jgi:SAM-dependent methyltransferase
VSHQKFDVAKIARLDDPGRFVDLDPAVMWGAVGFPDPEVIVDIGAGTGMFARRFAALAPRATVYAADTEQAMLDWMNDHAVRDLGDRLRPLLSEETHVPLPDAVADLVVMINLHHELVDPAATYREALRLLRDGGRVLIVDWARNDLEGGPPQRIRAAPERIVSLLAGIGFDGPESHEGLPKHWIVTARKNVP